jgi:hypothetical protein
MNVSLEDVRKAIIKIVEDSQGIKVTELLPSLSKEIITCNYSIVDEIDNLIKDQELVCINYIIPSMPYREKMYLLPKGSTVTCVVF